ncbi:MULTISPECIES: HAMP domain-containing sensor histidine kinase [Spirulina sp. CCY15215]|uniref:sensor histidine kinase n=1 Tax=Spirulina sp. CCY15215 TaxID=2767591 RepID=UPI0032B01292
MDLHGSIVTQDGLKPVAFDVHEDCWLQVTIADNGSGIPDEVRDRLFEPFFTTKEVGKGTGLGLSISRQIIVEKHGGTIDVASTMGEGTTFTIKIPLQATPAT